VSKGAFEGFQFVHEDDGSIIVVDFETLRQVKARRVDTVRKSPEFA